MEPHLEVYPLQQLLHWCGFGGSALPPPPDRPFRLLLFLIQHVHIDELEGAHFVVEESHPCSHRRLTDDIDHIPSLNTWNREENSFLKIVLWFKFFVVNWRATHLYLRKTNTQQKKHLMKVGFYSGGGDFSLLVVLYVCNGMFWINYTPWCFNNQLLNL